MRTERIRRSRIPWGAVVSLAGVILLVVMGLPWIHGSAILASHGSTARPDAAAAWHRHIQKMESALGQGALHAAEANWLVAHLVVSSAPTWEGWIGVGDAARRLGGTEGHTAFVLRARQAYQKAVHLASDQGSQAGVLAAADAFAALGDQSLADDLRILARKFAVARAE